MDTLNIIILVIGLVLFFAGLGMIIFYVVTTRAFYSTNPLTTEQWAQLKIGNTPSSDPSSTFTNWKLGVKALPTNLKIYPAHTLAPKQKLPKTFYFKTCELVPSNDQGNCQSCTLFASYSMLASRLAIQTGNQADMLSVQQALDCMNLPCQDPLTVDVGLNFASSVGIVSAKVYPYQQVGNQPCLIQDSSAYNTRVFATTIQSISPHDGFTVGSKRHNNTIKRAMSEIYSFGPIVTIIELHSDLLYKYAATALDPKTNTYVCSIYSPNPNAVTIGYHAINVIGWQKPDPNSYTNACWICVTSWGNSWPQSPWNNYPGAFFMQMGTNCCGMEAQFVAAQPVIATF
jgi:C1A family cysteine protease